MSKKRTSVLLLIVPVIFICVAIAFATQMYPIYANTPFYGQDPAYQYLFAGVDILLGNAPAHNDHPGTPLQLLIAITIAVVWFVRHTLGIIGQEMFVNVLAEPELYLMGVSAVVVFFNSIAIFFIGLRVFKVTGRYLTAATCQLAPLVFVLTLPNVLYPSPESLLWCISLCLLGVLVPALLGDSPHKNIVSKKMAVFAGIFCGIGLAIKVTFLPLVGLLIILRSWRLILISITVMSASWFVGVLPIYSRLGLMFGWLHKVINHSGLHGAGQNAVFNSAEFIGNISYVRSMYPLLDTAVWMMVIVSLWGFIKYQILAKKIKFDAETQDQNIVNKINNYSWFTAFVLSLVVIGQGIMVAKHPGPTYMIPVLPITVIAFAWLLDTQKFLQVSKLLKKLLHLSVFMFFAYQAATSSLSAYQVIKTYHAKGTQENLIIQETIHQYKNPILIGTFNCTLPQCALWFGQLMTPEVQLKMDHVTTDFYHFDIFAKNLHVPGQGALSKDDTSKVINGLIAVGQTVLLISPPYDQLANFDIEKLVSTPVQVLYLVKGYKNSQ